MTGSLDKEKFRNLFSVPPEVEAVIDIIVTPAEQNIIALTNKGIFSAEELSVFAPGADANTLYKRGILNICETNEKMFSLADFYTRLDVFVVSEHEKYMAFPKEIQKALDSLYFELYYSRLKIDSIERPSADETVTSDEALSIIDKETRQAYLAYCDCRVLAANYSECGAPLQTCLSFRNGLNTMAHRGISKPVSKDEAKRTVIEADNAGLMHTANGNTICNCCADCCYLSRARNRRNRELDFHSKNYASWPKTTKRVCADWEKCAACGICETRCPFHLFKIEEKVIDSGKCIGCSLCVNSCPQDALRLEML